jgi:uncharacterized heparinase superfamily protein
MADLLTYWHTLRHLRPVQFYGRMWFRIYRPKPDLSPAPGLRQRYGPWAQPASKTPSLLEPMTFRFLNETHTLAQRGDWDDQGIDKLWRYNLHYFDDLNARNAAGRNAWHRALMERWVAENPPGWGSGWEPYPTSLRIVNWIKWVLAGNELSLTCRHSLTVQARWLSNRLEIHLPGNHLFANAKALVFAGLFFEGIEANRWLNKGLRILERDIPGQILPDGGQFERSTMYHALALEDMLDLCNVTAAYADGISPRRRSMLSDWPAVVERMRKWLAAMCHPDGEIGFFNDAAIGIAPSPFELEAYAGRMGYAPLRALGDGVQYFADSGYIRMQQGPMTALLDVAPVGPDHLPGHAHADTLSFELSFFGQRVIVNSGTSCYGLSPERLRQRGTAAHSTVVIDRENSSEIWGGFRVARRAMPRILSIDETGRDMKVAACHNGYERLPGNNIHQRSWTALENSLLIQDELSGPFAGAEARFHLHPDIKIESRSEGENQLMLQLPSGRKVLLTIEGGTLSQEVSSWHPSFGCSEPNICLVVHIHDHVMRTTLDWSDHT